MYKKMAMMAALVSLAGIHAARAESDLDFVVNALPASLLIDASGDKFAVTGPDGTRTSQSEIYTMPNIALGVGMPVGDAYVDLVGGGGIIINDSFRSFMLQAILEANWLVSQSLTVGPRLGLIYLPDPEWTENDDIEFEEDYGYLLGIGMSMGDKIKYIVSVDWIDSTLDVDTSGGGVPNESQFELTALAIQFGVRGEF